VASPAEKQALRASLGLPPDAFIVGCVAAVKKDHKRIDYLIREMREVIGYELSVISNTNNQQPITNNPYLLIAGAKTSETPELLALAESLIPGRYKIMTDCSRARMPDLLRAMDVFVLGSLFEMMPIALLEALGSGLPCLVHQHPVLEWMIGVAGADQLLSCPVDKLLSESPEGSLSSTTQQLNNATTLPRGGMSLDMGRPGVLAQVLAGLTPGWIAEHGRQARAQALKMFSQEAVIAQYVAYYKRIVRCKT
jgi:glycosyltransferase involved in cell wall biosynthesis